MLRKPVVNLSVVLVGVIAAGTMLISNACHAPSAKAEAYIVQLAGLVEIANGDMERLLAQWAADTKNEQRESP
ncbi:MAG: hypothetical protein OEU92_30890 [Alphaproteobacteria bacterium]|nr:hypothetical protein [Alphaproteobacteria bacterium]